MQHASYSRALRVETPSVERAMTMNRRRSLLHVGILFLMAVDGSPAHSEIDRSVYRYSTIDEVIAKHGLRVGPTEIAENSPALVAPEYKYRLRLRATPDTVEALSAWRQTHRDLPEFLKEYTHEVEVGIDGRSVWLIWQRSLVAPFRAELISGGDIDIYAILAGTFRGKLLLLVTTFESL